MAKSSNPSNPLPKKPEPEKKEIKVSRLPGWMWFILFLATILIIIGIAVATHKSSPPKGQAITTAEKWVHGWTDETNGRMKTMPTTVEMGNGILTFRYFYGNGSKGRGTGTIQSDGSYLGTWSDSCGHGTFWLKPEGNSSHFTGWQTDNRKHGKKFPMFLIKIN